MFVDSDTEKLISLKHRLKCLEGSVSLFDRNRKVLKRSEVKTVLIYIFIFIHIHTHLHSDIWLAKTMLAPDTWTEMLWHTRCSEYLLSKINLTRSIPEGYKTPQRLKGLSQSCDQERNKILSHSSKSCRCASPYSMIHIRTLINATSL